MVRVNNMNKELNEAWNRIKTAPNFMGGTPEYRASMQSETPYIQDCALVENALLELKAIKETKPSEELEILDDFKNGLVNKETGMIMFNQVWFKNQINTIKQALIKGQEQDFNYKNIVMPFFDELVKLLETNDTDEMLEKIKEQKKAFSIIKEKDVDIFMLNDLETLEEYNGCIELKYGTYYQLTQEEYDLLIRYLRDDKSE